MMTRRMLRTLTTLSLAIACVALFSSAWSVMGAASAAAQKGSGLPFSDKLAELGDQIFDDQNLSIGRNQGCNACHSQAWGFTGPNPNINAHGAVYEGSIAGRFGDRKPPSSAYSTLSPIFGFTRTAGGLFEGGNFWEVGVPEVSGRPAVLEAHDAMQSGKRSQRLV